ncbi:ParB N-terminal domain-containing protein [Endozoicomonas sp. G2_1]|uniref:polymorphic toxin-type HINT domain-containing protein n=1 Tax=Endozoicomonas sp. G2_1 TaxID=2821091 RepID=UPI001AD972AD|nr:polymorphic toxin-type HINT domain-containing protein [Endozoicomonas sp. G2_1]MBO9492018.1 ParB N-terminal domain-containing protein [Endozoicomonas sp. G2_1]
MQARYYDPVIGRFYSNDPVDALGHASVGKLVHGFNRYAYVNNNPYKYIDPTGMIGMDTVQLDRLSGEQAIQIQGEVGGNIVSTIDTASDLTGVAGAIKGVVKAGAKAAAKKALSKSPCPLSCFVAGTQVLTKEGHKPIEDISVGELVWAKNVQTGKSEWKAVTHTWTVYDKDIYEISVRTLEGVTQTIEATESHPFYVLGKGWRDTVDLQLGDKLVDNEGVPLVIVSLRSLERKDTAYNFTVADFHTYYVTQQNILVHNCGGDRQMVNPKNLVPTQTKSEMSGSNVKRLTKSMKKDGFVEGKGDDGPVSVVVGPTGKLEIENGHHRVQAAIKAKIDKIPVEVYKGGN